MKNKIAKWSMLGLGTAASFGLLIGMASAQNSSYMPVVIKETFDAIVARMTAAKPQIMQRQQALLAERYDLSDHTASGITMSKGKPLQAGVRVKLEPGTTWDMLAQLTPEEIKKRIYFPKASCHYHILIIQKVECSFPTLKLKS